MHSILTFGLKQLHKTAINSNLYQLSL